MKEEGKLSIEPDNSIVFGLLIVLFTLLCTPHRKEPVRISGRHRQWINHISCTPE
jgi:hypothetical protein